MAESKKDILVKMGVGHDLAAYETFFCSAYDAERGMTCNAEARMDSEGLELVGEIQIIHDTPPVGQPPMEQVFTLIVKPSGADGWNIISARLKGEAVKDDLYNWRDKSCRFFRAVAQELQLDTIPDIDDLIDREFHSRERFDDQRQGGGGKSPKMKGAQLMGMKKGGGF